MKVVVLVDGEHYPSVTRWAIDGLRGSPSAHRHDDRFEPQGGRDPRRLARHGRLAGPLPRADDRDGRDGERRLLDRRVEPEVRAEVGHPLREGDRGDLHPLAVAEDRLVRQIEDRLRVELVDRLADRRRDGCFR